MECALGSDFLNDVLSDSNWKDAHFMMDDKMDDW